MQPEIFGYAPASPRPKKARTATSVPNRLVSPVNAVQPDHQRTIRVTTFLRPKLSPQAPLGISNSA